MLHFTKWLLSVIDRFLSTIQSFLPSNAALLTTERIIMRDQPEIVRNLREQSRQRNCSISLLHLVAGSDKQCAVEAARYLLDHEKYPVDLPERDGITPLQVAANWDNLAMCQLLLSYGADPYLEDHEGRSALDLSDGKCREFLLKFDKLSTSKKRNLLRRFLYVIKPKPANKTLAQRFGPRRWARSLGGCLIGLSQAGTSKELESCPSPAYKPSERSRPAKEPAKTAKIEEVVVDDNENTPSIPIPSTSKDVPPPAIASSQETEYFDALDVTPHVTTRRKKLTKAPEVPGPSNSSQSKDRGIPNSEVPLETTLEYLTCDDEEEEQTIVIPDWIERLHDRHLRMRLETLKQKVGPITKETRLLYRRRLALLLKDAPKKNTVQYSAPLQRLLDGRSPAAGRPLDKAVREAFRSNIASPHQRQGNSAAFFCYLLIDPTLIPPPAAECSFPDFVGAIFYVGKGKKSRPVQHLVDAAKSRANNIPRSDKLKKILGLWDSGRGVVSLQVFQNVISVESHCREGAMLEAIGIRNLTNLKRGEFYDICNRWTARQKEEFGAFLLHSAWKIFKIEGSREIFEKDVL